ncbi:RICIN domain-containing protein [Streptomyces sp. NPDC006289]|uniref:RICIN domain-containing protein n=1 Tax=Streptomyces sp. NPDC006289 TaxID=3156744 RepID=UPI0033AC88A4
MADLSAGRSYVITNRKMKGVVNVWQNDCTPGAGLNIEPLLTGTKRNSQVWHLFPLDQGTVLFVNKNSGQVMNVHNNNPAPGEWLEQYYLQDDPAALQTWLVRDAPGGGVYLVNKRTGMYTNIHNNAIGKNEVEQYYFQNDPANAQVWDLQVEDEYTPVLGLPHVDRDPMDIGDVIRLTDFKQPTKKQTEQVLLGQVAMPFILVQDTAVPRERQASETPYYFLKRYGYWALAYYFEHSGASAYTKTQGVTVGLTTSNSQQVQNTTGIVVKADASFSYKGASASLSTTLSQELKVTTTSSTTQESTRTDTVSRTYAAGKRIAEAIWFKEDRYVLERMDGSKVTEWAVRDPDTLISDSYPD